MPITAQTSGPIVPPRAPDVVRLPNNPAPEKPPIPAEEIIRQLAANQDEAANARDRYIYRKIVLLAEMGDDGKPAGQDQVTTEFAAQEDGTWRPKTSHKPDSSLQVVSLEPDALAMLSSIPSFPFTTPQLAKYEIAYQAMEPVDELMTYVFRVTPKLLDRTHAYFSGLIWVDNHDLAIVKSYGKWVMETGDVNPGGLPFTMFETYSQPVMNKFWMPAYSRSDGFAKGQIPVRLTIRWDDYKVAGKAVPAPAAAPAATPANPAH
jgi:hypothetical protein